MSVHAHAPRLLRRLAQDERGASTIMELLVLLPVLMLLALLIVFAGRLASMQEVVKGAARDAARAASITRPAGAAGGAANAAIATDLAGHSDLSCGSAVSPPIPGGTVTATLTCTVSMADLTGLGLPGTKTFTATHRAPVDFFRGD